MIKIASLFSGIGGFEKGMIQADSSTEIVFSSEIDKYARQIYKKNYGVEPHGDITKINASDVPDHDILCGGFPCQDVSIAGKREGLCGARSGLFYEIIRILREKQPTLVFLENVKGLLSSNRGWDFARILIELEDAGYKCEWQVFNSKNHGVPQNRERVFLIGHLRGAGTRPIFPITNSIEAVSEKGDGNNISTGCISTRNQSGQANWDGSTTLIANAIDANYYKEIDNHGQRTAINQLNEPTHSNNRVYNPNGISPAINCAEGGNRQPFILCDSEQGRKDQLQNETIPPLRANTGAGHNNIVCHSTLPRNSTSGKGGTGHLQRDDELSYCCDAKNNIAVEVNQQIRRLTPIECERLQGFPDNFTAEGIDDNGNIVKISDTQRYKTLGNAVTTTVIQFIFESIISKGNI